jgi:hypothetical protein
MFRGVALVRGYNIESFIYAVGFVARNTVSSTDTLSVQLNGVFESVNIVVLNYVVENAGQAFPFQYGSMAVRAFTFFLPSTIWAGRPEGFGVLLGRTINDATSGVAFNSTMLGEAYGNFGSFWPIFLFLLLWVFHLMFKLLGNGRPVVGFVAAFCAIAMWRFDVTFATVNVFFLLMILVAMRQANQLTATIRLRRTPVSAGATQSQQ